MKVTETITRDCCTPKDLKPVEGCRMYGRFPVFQFCIHCGARYEYHGFIDAAGSSDYEYRKVKEDVGLPTKLAENIKLD